MLGVAVSVYSQTAPANDQAAKMIELPIAGSEDSRLMIRSTDGKLTVPKESPQHGWKFEWMLAGYGRTSGPPTSYGLRFRVYSQEPSGPTSPAQGVLRLLLRLWDLNTQRLKLDHSEAYGDRIIDVYLCDGGKAGGEQRFDVEERNGRRQPVNTIYIYDIGSFTSALEMAREVAHEYGHATLPPVGGFTEPEEWANGHLGERLFLSWLRDLLKSGELTPYDNLGASVSSLSSYLEKNVKPLVLRTLTNGPDLDLLSKKGNDAMQEYLALTLYAEAVLPPRAFSRSLMLNDVMTAKGSAKALVDAAAEAPKWVLKATGLKGTKIWIPLAKGKLAGASGLKRRGDWVLISVDSERVTITNPIEE